MAELGISIAQKLIDVIGLHVVKEICGMWGYESQLSNLIKTVSTIKNVFLDAERKELSNEERGFIEELKAAVYDADNLFDEFRTLAELKQLYKDDNRFFRKVRRFFSSKKKGVRHAYRMFEQVSEINKRLDANVLYHKKIQLNLNYEPIIRKREETYSYMRDVDDIIGRENDEAAIIDKLLDPNVSVNNGDPRFLTIVGMGGLRKNTLAKLVYNDEKIKKEFSDETFRLWVCVADQDGKKLDALVILRKILELITNHKVDGDSMEWVQKQFQKHLKGNKYLFLMMFGMRI